MNANVDIRAGGVEHVLVIPEAAISKKDGKSFVNLVTSEKKKKYKEVEVQTGFVGDNNLTQVISGLKEGDKVAFTKN
jgi:multidrug efflux pump subunit AcrA (membrane-fusion protein)